MKQMAVMIASLCLITASWAQGDHTKKGRKPMQMVNASRIVAPALEKYAQGPLAELWNAPASRYGDSGGLSLHILWPRLLPKAPQYYPSREEFDCAVPAEGEQRGAACHPSCPKRNTLPRQSSKQS